jgi:Lon protease-like protein
MNAMADTIPLFPLQLVLFPGGPLRLRIFEARYVDMIGRCMREGSEFGVARLIAGREVGPGAQTESVGTSARIIDFEQLKDGLLGITAVGHKRFTILAMRQQADGLNVADIEWMPADTDAPLPTDSEPLARLLRHTLPQLGGMYDAMPMQLEDASWVGSRCVEILPLPLDEKQRCLEMLDPLRRLDRLHELVQVNELGTKLQ